ncbi:MAG: hypothetical protein DDT19_02350 [Syntrophomonadaceae bacterium]|nr:hypothetical protein [Bacillota bacterium]
MTLRRSTTGNVFAIRNTGDTADTFTITDAGIVNLGTWQGTAVAVAFGGTGATTIAGARTNLGAAASGANSDITSLSGLTTALSIGQGGTGQTTALAAFNALSPLTTRGDILTRDATNNIRVPVGTDGQVLTADSTQTAGVRWAAVGAGGITWPLLSTIDGTVSAPAYSWGADTNMGIRRGGIDDLRFVTAGADRLTIDSAGNVGIGMTAPGATLHVGGRVGDVPGEIDRIAITPFGHISGPFFIRSRDDVHNAFLDLRYGTGSPIMTIVHTGNVGIGTTAPATRLHVVGVASIGAAGGIGGGTTGLHLTAPAGVAGNTSTGIFFGGDGIAHANIAWMPHERNFVLRTGNAPTDMTDWYGGANLVLSGRIGVGTTTPVARLTIHGDAHNDAGQMIRLGYNPASDYSIWRSVATGHLNFDGSQTGFIGYRFNSGHVGIGVGRAAGLTARLHVIGADSLNTSFAGNISGATGTGLVVTNANNVGIGTATPTSPLTVAGVIHSSTGGFRFPDGTTQTTAAVGAGGGIGGSGTLNRVARFTTANTIGDSQIFDTGTNVGIGTTTPPARLTIHGDAFNDAGQMIRLGFSPTIDYSIWRSVATGHLNFDGSQTGFIGYRFNSGHVGIGVGRAAGLTARLHVIGADSLNTSFAGNIGGAAGTGLVITNANNVGIGTTAPATRLHVEGTVRMTGFQLGTTATAGHVLTTDASGVGTWQPAAAGGVTWPLLSTIDGTVSAPAYSWGADTNMGIRRGGIDDLRFVTAGADRLTIDSAGNVGIGTTGPARRLEVLNADSVAQLRLSQSSSIFTEFTVAPGTGDLTVSLYPSASANDIILNMPGGSIGANLWVCEGDACPSLSLSTGGNLIVERDIFATGFRRISCPPGMIEVPPSPQHGLDGFCVDKYEAKNVGGIATSQADLTPWVFITQFNARAECIRAGKRLLTEREWLAIAHNIERVGWNWNGGVAGVNQMSDGHSDGAPAGGLAADVIGDPDDDPCVGTGQVCDLTVWNSQRRTYRLSNGQHIWDFGGNVWEWVDQVNEDDYPMHNSPIPSGFVACSPTGDGICGNTLTTNDQWFRGGTVVTRGFIRGGAWNIGANSGAFTLNLNNAPTFTYPIIGFRCAR